MKPRTWHLAEVMCYTISLVSKTKPKRNTEPVSESDFQWTPQLTGMQFAMRPHSIEQPPGGDRVWAGGKRKEEGRGFCALLGSHQGLVSEPVRRRHCSLMTPGANTSSSFSFIYVFIS